MVQFSVKRRTRECSFDEKKNYRPLVLKKNPLVIDVVLKDDIFSAVRILFCNLSLEHCGYGQRDVPDCVRPCIHALHK